MFNFPKSLLTLLRIYLGALHSRERENHRQEQGLCEVRG